MNNVNSQVASPCIGHCCLDEDDMCVGCFRMLDEILNWAASDDRQRLDVITLCESRKATVGAEKSPGFNG